MKKEYTTIPEIKKRIILLDKQKAKLNTELSYLQKNLVNMCDHTDYKIVDTYVEGDYYNTAEYWQHKICNICGLRFDEYLKGKGSYG